MRGRGVRVGAAWAPAPAAAWAPAPAPARTRARRPRMDPACCARRGSSVFGLPCAPVALRAFARRAFAICWSALFLLPNERWAEKNNLAAILCRSIAFLQGCGRHKSDPAELGASVGRHTSKHQFSRLALPSRRVHTGQLGVIISAHLKRLRRSRRPLPAWNLILLNYKFC